MIESTGGVVTRGETFSKLLHHLDEARECASVMAHLHNTEGNDADTLLAKGWLGVAELFLRLRHQVTELATKRMQ
jgi:hypothetical protein